MKKVLLLLPLFSLIFTRSTGQNIQIGGMLGATLLQGDYPSYSFGDTFRILANPGFGIFIRRPVNQSFGIKASVYFSSFAGDDHLNPVLLGSRTPTDFKYSFMEFQVSGEYYPFHFNFIQRQASFFVMSGISATKTTINNTDISEDCPLFNLNIPFGGGFRLQVSELLQATLQAEVSMSFSDCLDGYHGFTNVKDLYSSIKLGISYGIVPEANKGKGKSIGCPAF
ncbi:MAG: hypothetical protein SH818_05655 [Saprospiraceae bacterium]|nr:hypothetical protein [Saprospiraceae bacterium]